MPSAPDLHLGPERGLRECDRQRALEVVALAREEGVVADVDDDVEIARRAAGTPPSPSPAMRMLRALVDPGRNAHLERPLVRDPPLTRQVGHGFFVT